MTFLKRNIKSKSKNKKIYILLTRFNDGGAKLLSAITGSYYTHASIGLEEDMNTFYSFVYKGFIVEQITRYLKPDKEPLPCELYELEVCEKKYKRIKKYIEGFVSTKKRFCYTRLGVAMCLFGIPHKKELSYFCSQFVAEVLKKTGAADLKKKAALYLPRDLKKIPGLKLNFRGNLLTFSQHFGLLPCNA